MSHSRKEEARQVLQEQKEINNSYKQDIYEAGEVYTLEAKRTIARQVVLSRIGYEDKELVEQIVTYLVEEEHPT